MFENKGFQDFDDDPFFSGFSSNFSFPFQVEDRRNQRRRSNEVARNEFPFGNTFGNMQQMMNNLSSQMVDFEKNPDAHCYTSSTVMSYQNDGRSQPKLVQASKSSRMAPGQIKETRRTYRNSKDGVEKMAIGRHLGGKSHEIEKRRIRGGDIEEETRYHGLDEDELSQFEHEWQQRARNHRTVQPARNNRVGDGRRNDDRSIRRVAERRPTGPGRSGRH